MTLKLDEVTREVDADVHIHATSMELIQAWREGKVK